MKILTCKGCGSARLEFSGPLYWNVRAQRYDAGEPFDDVHCPRCDNDVEIEEFDVPHDPSDALLQLCEYAHKFVDHWSQDEDSEERTNAAYARAKLCAAQERLRLLIRGEYPA